jgi:hypothetical protein
MVDEGRPSPNNTTHVTIACYYKIFTALWDQLGGAQFIAYMRSSIERLPEI